MEQLRLFDVYDRETGALMMTVEATDSDQAIGRVMLTGPHLDKLLTPGGLIVLREHDAETLVTAPYLFRDGHFLLLESLTPTQH
jgi:hypothetical protein